jgi:hypothetical protein
MEIFANSSRSGSIALIDDSSTEIKRMTKFLFMKKREILFSNVSIRTAMYT